MSPAQTGITALTGTRALLKGVAMLKSKGIRRFVAVPIILNIIIFACGLRFAWSGFERGLAVIENYLPQWLSFLTWLLWPLFIITLLLVIAYGFTFIANIIGAPFYGLLSEKVEQLSLGFESNTIFSWRNVFAILPRTLLRELQKLIYYIAWFIPLCIFSLLGVVFPIISPITTALWFIFGAWIFAMQYIDYPYDNHQLPFSALKKDMQEQRMKCLSFGAAVSVISMVPIVNIIAMPAAVCGGTLLWSENFLDKQDRKQQSRNTASSRE